MHYVTLQHHSNTHNRNNPKYISYLLNLLLYICASNVMLYIKYILNVYGIFNIKNDPFLSLSLFFLEIQPKIRANTMLSDSGS